MQLVYLDHNATTPVAPEVRTAMDACLTHAFGNPSSLHHFGQQARHLLDVARLQVGALLGAAAEEVIFTSGGTEASNLALLGVAQASGKRRHILTTAIEHPATLNPCAMLESEGYAVTYAPVDVDGRVDLGACEHALSDETLLVSIMLANNEVGTIEPVTELAALAHARGALVHCDAVQAIGKIPVNVHALGVDLLSVSSHKLYGPKGAGALYVKRGTSITGRQHGGGQERRLRPGTENVPGIVGLGAACALARARLTEETPRIRALRDELEQRLLAEFPGLRVNAKGTARLPNTTSLCLPAVSGEALAVNLDLLGVAISTASACSTGEHAPSHVLTAMGQSEADAKSTVRVSLGRATTRAHVDTLILALTSLVRAEGGRLTLRPTETRPG